MIVLLFVVQIIQLRKNGSLYYCSPKANLNTCAKESISFNKVRSLIPLQTFYIIEFLMVPFVKADLTGGIKDKISSVSMCKWWIYWSNWNLV